MRRAVMMALAISTVSCSSEPVGPDGPGLLRTDQVAYTARPLGSGSQRPVYGFSIVATFRNESSRTVYLARCSSAATTPIYWVSMADAASESAFAHPWACTGASDLSVAPGESRTDAFDIRGPNIWLHDGTFAGDREGRMRLHYDVRCASDCAGIAGLGVSNEFEVLLAP